MRLEELISFLETNDVAYKDAGQRIYLEHCFECGNNKWKVTFKDTETEFRVLYGRCFRCGSEFSSYRYLVDVGFSVESVRDLHKFDNLSIENAQADFIDLLSKDDAQREAAAEKVPYSPPGMDVDGLFRISEWENHPAAKYARKRGVPKELDDYVLIDPITNSVVFLCKEGEKVLGWQKRFVNPPRPSFKTLNPPADQFKKSMHVIEYPNTGPLVVCEGPFTGISAWQMGYHAIVTFGSAVSKSQMAHIARIVAETKKSLLVSFDLDPAGFKGFFKLKNFFERRGLEVRRLEPEAGNDLNDSWQKGQGAREIVDDPYDSSVPVLELFKDIYQG